MSGDEQPVDEPERIRRAVREALEQLAARRTRPNGPRRPDTRGWAELQNDARSTL